MYVSREGTLHKSPLHCPFDLCCVVHVSALHCIKSTNASEQVILYSLEPIQLYLHW